LESQPLNTPTPFHKSYETDTYVVTCNPHRALIWGTLMASYLKTRQLVPMLWSGDDLWQTDRPKQPESKLYLKTKLF